MELPHSENEHFRRKFLEFPLSGEACSKQIRNLASRRADAARASYSEALIQIKSNFTQGKFVQSFVILWCISLEPIHRPRNRLSALNFASGLFQLKVTYDSSIIRSLATPIRGHMPVRKTSTWTAKSARDARLQATMRFLLVHSVVSLPTPIELSRLHHKCDEWLDERTDPLRLEHQRDHRVRSELGTHYLTEELPCHATFCADEYCVLCIIHREIALATHLLVSLLKAPQVRVKTSIAWERLRQIKADFPVLSVQPGSELRD